MSNEIIHNGITSPLKVGDTIGLFPVDGTSINWDATEEGAEAVTITHADHKYAYFTSNTTGSRGKFTWTLRSTAPSSGYPQLYYKPDNFHNCYELLNHKEE